MLATVILLIGNWPGFTVGVVLLPVVSNFPTHIPFNSVSPKVNAGCV